MRRKNKSVDSKVLKWIRWLSIIENEVCNLLVARDIFLSTQKLIEQNKNIQKPSSFYKYFGDSYISHIVMGIRRQIKNDGRSISFLGLLSEIKTAPKLINRKYYKNLYTGSAVVMLADRDFNQFCRKSTDNSISPFLVQKDIDSLCKITKTCEKFADKRIAHRDKKPPKIPLKFSNINKSLKTLDRLFCKYYLLLHARSLQTLMPHYQYDWQRIFDYNWRKKNIL